MIRYDVKKLFTPRSDNASLRVLYLLFWHDENTLGYLLYLIDKFMNIHLIFCTSDGRLTFPSVHMKLVPGLREWNLSGN